MSSSHGSNEEIADMADMADKRKTLDRSDEADARRFRWLLAGNGYFLEEEMLCGHEPCSDDEQDKARIAIDEAMSASQ